MEEVESLGEVRGEVFAALVQDERGFAVWPRG